MAQATSATAYAVCPDGKARVEGVDERRRRARAVVGVLGDVHGGEEEQPAGDERDRLDRALARGAKIAVSAASGAVTGEEPMWVTTLATLTSMSHAQALGDVGGPAVDPRLGGRRARRRRAGRT